MVFDRRRRHGAPLLCGFEFEDLKLKLFLFGYLPLLLSTCTLLICTRLLLFCFCLLCRHAGLLLFRDRLLSRHARPLGGGISYEPICIDAVGDGIR
jgi:hypothetical protein